MSAVRYLLLMPLYLSATVLEARLWPKFQPFKSSQSLMDVIVEFWGPPWQLPTHSHS